MLLSKKGVDNLKKIASIELVKDIVAEISGTVKREISRANCYEESISKKNKKYVQFDKLIHDEIDEYKTKNQNIPIINYVAHEASDGYLSSLQLSDVVEKYDNSYSVIHNPVFDCGRIESYIKLSAIKRVALSEGIVKPKSISSFHMVATIGSVLWVVLQVIHTVVELLNTGGAISDVVSEFGVWYWILLVLGFFLLISVVAIFLWNYVNNRKNIIIEVNQAINKMKDDEFNDFVNMFVSDDFKIDDLKSDKKELIVVCCLRSYLIRERTILLKYLSEIRKKQFWWIFFEESLPSEFLLDRNSELRQIDYFRLHGLDISSKNSLKNCKIGSTCEHDPELLKNRGLDYFYKKKINSGWKNEDIDIQWDYVENFIKEKEKNVAHVEKILRLISELVVNYHVDLNNSFVRRDISFYDVLDDLISEEVVFKKNELNDILLDIKERFDGLYRDVLILFGGRGKFEGYDEWCLSKALKIKKPHEDSVEDIIESVKTLFEKYDPEYFQNEIWLEMFWALIRYLQNNKQYWFIPFVLNFYIRVFDNIKNTRLVGRKIFSLPEIVKIADANLFFGFKYYGDNKSMSDSVYIHYKIISKAVWESNPDFDFYNNNHKPDECFSLLNLNPNERQCYFNCLRALPRYGFVDNKVEQFYSYIFDIYCVVLRTYLSDIKFEYNEIYNNLLYDKYFKNRNISNPKTKDYLLLILANTLQLIKNISVDYSDSVRDLVIYLENIFYLDESDGNIEQELMYILAESDIIGTESLSFVTCLLNGVLIGIDYDSDVYFKFSNYLFGLVFLTYYEGKKGSFLNTDFKELIGIFEGYIDPPPIILGYISCVLCFALSKSNISRLQDFMKLHLANKKYLNQVLRVAEIVNKDDLIDYIIHIECVDLLDYEDRIEVYNVLRNRLSDFSKLSIYPCFVEYLSLLFEHKHSDEFLNDSIENNIKKLKDCNPTFIHLIYNHYFDYSDYMNYCYEFIDEVSCSRIASCAKLLFEFWITLKQNDNEMQVKAAKEIMNRLQDTYFKYNYDLLIEYKDVVLQIRVSVKENQELYENITEDELNILLFSIQKRIDDLIVIESEDMLAVRNIENYGIIMFLRAVILSYCRFSLKDTEYKVIDDEEKKLEYQKQHYSEIQPLIFKDKFNCYNVAYLDLINSVIINKGNIQSLQTQKMWSKKFIDDAIMIVGKLDNIPQKNKKRFVDLLNIYRDKSIG